jgi:glyoxylase-like metal-dependent hydrolase (beta-lactamase superfamily II)
MSVKESGVFRPERAATRLDAETWLIDLGFQGRGGVVAAYLLVDRGELALIESGPGSTYMELLAGVRQAGFDPARIKKILVTHIHLDHAGAAGLLAREDPERIVFVHPFGAPHLIDPGKLIASATRIYGDRMAALWGEFVAIPAAQVVPLEDNQTLRVAGRGMLFTGDVGGVRMQGTPYNCPPTPPPDFDPVAWAGSIACMRDLNARRWCLTHFGAFDDIREHVDQLLPNLETWIAIGLTALDRGAERDEITTLFHQHMAARIGDVPAGILTNLEWATPSYMATLGIARYHKQRSAAES